MRKRKLVTGADQSYRQILARQGYHAVGRAGAVKPCLWMRRSLRNGGVCYKEQFYGVRSHRCIQMTPILRCNQRCLHCWRATDIDTFDCPGFDEPHVLVEGSIAAQENLISGYKGHSGTNIDKLTEAHSPNQVAISLSGEPTLYPYLDELIELYQRRDMTTFLVSNGSSPDVLARTRPTQLYLSLNSPDEAHFYALCRPRAHGFEQLLESLTLLADHPSRTAVRITLANGVNTFDPAGYARLLELADPDYIEVKSYMHLGFSRKRLPRTAMLSYEDVLTFARRIAGHAGYAIAGGSPISRVVVLTRDGAIRRITG